MLYASYNRLPPEIYKIVKMDLKSKEFKTPFLQIVDLFAKLVLTIGVALISFFNDPFRNIARIREER